MKTLKIANNTAGQKVLILDEKNNLIAHCFAFSNFSNKQNMTVEEAENNALILSNSFEMLEALKMVSKDWEQFPCKPSHNKIVNDLIEKLTL